MEADWEFEIGGDAPVIDACWPGFIDLRWTAQSGPDPGARVRSLPETAQLPGLAVALERLNSESSPIWTSKCDFWPALQPEEFDADELDAPSGSFAHASGCFIDLLPKSEQDWALPDTAAAACRSWCAQLHVVPLRCCRVDLVIRRALIAPLQIGTGITAYFTACGRATAEAVQALEDSLAAFTNALCSDSTLQ